MKAPMHTLEITAACLLFLATGDPTLAFYDPSLQRWLNRDPLGEFGAQNPIESSNPLLIETARLNESASEFRFSDAMHLYRHDHNDPVNRLDPLGLRDCPAWAEHWCKPGCNPLDPPLACTGEFLAVLSTYALMLLACARSPFTKLCATAAGGYGLALKKWSDCLKNLQK